MKDEPRAKQYWESSLDGINLNRSVPNSTYDGMYLRRFYATDKLASFKNLPPPLIGDSSL